MITAAADPTEYEIIMKPIQCLVETAVYADDLDRAERFYRETLGLTVKLITPGLWGLPATW